VLTLNLSTRALWQPPVLSGGPVSSDISGASRRMGEGNENLVYPSRKILQHGTSGFSSHPKGGVLRIFSTIKNPSSWLCSNSQTLGLVVSTLTTTPLRRLKDRWSFTSPSLYTNMTWCTCSVVTLPFHFPSGVGVFKFQMQIESFSR
jgi:hypothetical protein